MKKLLILCLLSSMLLAGCSDKDKVVASGLEGDDIQREVTYVKTTPVAAMAFTGKLSFPATLQPKEEVMVTAKVSGTVKELHGEVGDTVQKNQLICRLDDTMFQMQFNKSEISLKIEDINVEDAEKNYLRMKSLYDSQAISQADYEGAESKYRMSKELLDLAQNGYEQARENLADVNIFSPISGMISMKDVSIGENINPGKTLITIVDVSSLYAETGIPEKEISLIKQGQQVSIKVEALGGEVFQGKITNIGPIPTEPAKTYPIKVLINNRDKKLKAGMFAAIEIVTEHRKEALGVPREAILLENEKQYVYVEQEGIAVKKEVITAMEMEGSIEIASGLEKDEKVIVVGQEKLVDGALVEEK